jgi:hypothetical protein
MPSPLQRGEGAVEVGAGSGKISRETITVLSCQTLEAGAVLARISQTRRCIGALDRR